MIKTLGDRVLIKLDKGAETTEGGLVIPENARDKQTCYGTVLAISEHGLLTPKGKYLPLQVKVGDRVLVRQYAGTDVDVEGIPGAEVFRENDIYAIIEE